MTPSTPPSSIPLPVPAPHSLCCSLNIIVGRLAPVNLDFGGSENAVAHAPRFGMQPLVAADFFQGTLKPEDLFLTAVVHAVAILPARGGIIRRTLRGLHEPQMIPPSIFQVVRIIMWRCELLVVVILEQRK
jgi:hypothetical protein